MWKVVKATPSEAWSDDDESDGDFLDSGDDFSDDERDHTRYINLHENPDCKWSAHDDKFAEHLKKVPPTVRRPSVRTCPSRQRFVSPTTSPPKIRKRTPA